MKENKSLIDIHGFESTWDLLIQSSCKPQEAVPQKQLFLNF